MGRRPEYDLHEHMAELRRIDEYNRAADRLPADSAARRRVRQRRASAVRDHTEAADRHAGREQ